MKRNIFHKLTFLSILFTITFILSGYIQAQTLGSKVIRLDKWQFTKAPSKGDWTTVTVPHSCNAFDGHSPAYYRGKTYYKKVLTLSPSEIEHPLFILFYGAAQAAEISVNGKCLIKHKGGYTPFVIPLKDIAKTGDNEILVTCNNTQDLTLIPVTSDFNKNNGLHNPVYLLEMNDLYASPDTYGIYRLHVTTPNVSNTEALTAVETMIKNASNKNKSFKIILTLTDKNGKICYRKSEHALLSAGDSLSYKRQFTIKNPHLWNGIIDPYLYTVKIDITEPSGQVIDKINTEVGYRFYKLDADKGFFLNGHSYPLRGVAMHQDWDKKASALTNADFDKDYSIVKELGANFLRLAHYPHNDYAFRLCDKLGIVVQTEIPWVNVCGVNAKKEYFDNIHHQMKEMITNLYNHPSIVFWGMWNELDRWGNKDTLQGKLDNQRIVNETANLYHYAKSLDNCRYVGMSDCTNYTREGYDKLKADYYSDNRYNGWYYGKFDGFEPDCRYIQKHMGITNVSEYGCGINPFCQSLDTTQINHLDNTRHYEEYGNLFHESHIKQLLHMPFLNFTSLWIMFDFPVADRKEGFMDSKDGIHFTENNERKYMNDKGLVTRDRKIKKDVFYLYKSLWNKKQTTVYIAGKRCNKPSTNNLICIKVYSNAHKLTLYQNGIKKQTMNTSGEETGVIWKFKPLTMTGNNDTFRVVANDGTKDEY